MCKQKAPKPPDLTAQAKAQGEANKDTAIASAILSNPNFSNPYGYRKVTFGQPGQAAPSENQIYTTDGGYPAFSFNPNQSGAYSQAGGSNYGVPTVNVEEGFTPEMQRQFDAQNRIIDELNQTAEDSLSRVGDRMAQPFDETGLQSAGTINTGALRPATGFDANGLPEVGSYDLSKLRQGGSLNTDGMQDVRGLQIGQLPEGGNLDTSNLRGVAGIDLGGLTGRTVKGSVGGRDEIVQALRQREAPRFAQERSATEADLIARGFNPGGSGYDSRMDALNKQKNDFDLATLLAGGQEQSRLVGLESGIRGQDLAEQSARTQADLGIRGQQFGELSAQAALAEQQRARTLGERQARAQYQMALRGQQFGERQTLADYDDWGRSRDFAEQGAVLDQQGRARDRGFDERGSVAQFDAGLRSQQLAEQQAQSRTDADLRARQIQEQAYLRNLPLSELNALRTGGMPQAPQFQAYSGQTIAPPPLYNAAVDQYNAELGAYGAEGPGLGATLLTGGLGAAGAAGGFGNLFSFKPRAT